MRSDNGLKTNWESWVTHAIGGLEADQKNLHQRLEDNRQSAFRDLWLVRRELLGVTAHSAQKHTQDRYRWMRHVPWFKIVALFILAILVVTGHVSGTELKSWLMRRITEF